MTVVATHNYLTGLLAGRPAAPATPLAWFNDLRAHAVDRVGAATVPTTRDEDWRFTDISPLTKISFQPVRATLALAAADIGRFVLPEAGARLTFVDGVYAPQLSSNDSTAEVSTIAAGLGPYGAVMQNHLGRHAAFENNAFAALNTAFLNDGAMIVVPRNVAVAAPVHLLFIATQPEAASYPRCLVVAEAGSTVSLIEDFVSLQDKAYFTNAVTEIAVADNARVSHVRVQREGAQAFHIANCAVSLAHAGRYRHRPFRAARSGRAAHVRRWRLCAATFRQRFDSRSVDDRRRPRAARVRGAKPSRAARGVRQQCVRRAQHGISE